MAKVSVLIATLFAMQVTGTGAWLWYDRSSSDSSDQHVVSPNFCKYGKRRWTPGKPSASAMYLDGTGVLGGNQIQFTDGNSCVFSFKLDRGSYFTSSLWNSVGNIAYRYRCTVYNTTSYKSSWKDCSFTDSNWSVGIDVDTNGAITYANGCKTALSQWNSKPLFCRAYARCGPRGSGATTTSTSKPTTTTTSTKGTTTATIPPPTTTTVIATTTTTTTSTKGTTTATIPPPTTITEIVGGVTGTTSQATTTCPLLPTKCLPEKNCTDRDSNYRGKAGQPYTLTFTFEGNPPPTIVEALVGSTDLRPYVTVPEWIQGTVSTYKYSIVLPVVDFTVVGTWSVKGINNQDSGIAKTIEPTFSLTMDTPVQQIVFDGTNVSVKNTTAFDSTITGSVFQTSSCYNFIIGLGSDPNLIDMSQVITANLDTTKIKLNDMAPRTFAVNKADLPSYCLQDPLPNPVWMALTLQSFVPPTDDGYDYMLNFFIADYMTQPIDVINDVPYVSLGLTADPDLGENYIPTYTYFASNTGGTSVPQTCWLYQF